MLPIRTVQDAVTFQWVSAKR